MRVFFILDLFFLIVEFTTVFMIVNSLRNFHNRMLKSILHGTMQFFESTPVGRILNRFSKDLNSIELILPSSFKDFVFCILDVTTSLVLISIITPWFIAVLVPMIFLFLFIEVCIKQKKIKNKNTNRSINFMLIQRFYVASASKLKRLESITKSPIFAHFSETINGMNTIKAFRAQDRFTDVLETKIDSNSRLVYPSIVSER